MISGSNEQLQQQLKYTLLKPDCHSWWISKMQSDTLEERYAIRFCFKLGKNATETYEILRTAFRPYCMNRALVIKWHKGFKEGRKSVKNVGGVRKSIHQSWLAKGLGLGLLCWGFKGVQEEIPREEASTLQIGSVAFLPVHNSILVIDYLSKMGIKTVPQPPYCRDLAPCDFCLFPKLRGCRYETIDERGCDEGHWRPHTRGPHTRGLPWGLPEVVGTVQVRYSRRRLLRRGLEFHVYTINKSAHTKKVWKLILCTLYIYINTENQICGL